MAISARNMFEGKISAIRSSRVNAEVTLTTPEQLDAALKSKSTYQAELSKAGLGEISTEIEQAPTVYFAEAYHQQYLAKNPGGYCGLRGTGVCLPQD